MGRPAIQKVLSGGRVTIPQEFAKKYKVATGDFVSIEDLGGCLMIKLVEIRPRADTTG